MPWTRGSGSVEVELARTQDWIEAADPELHGHNGEKGVIRQIYEDRAFIRGAFWVFGLLSGGSLLIQLLHLAGIVK